MLSWGKKARRGARPGAHPAARAKGGIRALSRLPFAALLAALAGLVACGGTLPAPGATQTPPAETGAVIGPLEKGTTRMGATVATGGRVTIAAPENPTTGYAWTLDVPPGATLVSDDYEGPSPSASPLAGAGGTRTWVVRMDAVGQYAIVGAYARPWESHRPASRFVFTVFASPPDQPMPTLVFTGKDSPGLWMTDVGTVAAVALPENTSTGYAWTMTLGAGLGLLDEQASAPSPSPSPLVGAGGQHVWLIAVEKAGATTVTGEYARPAEPGGESAATFVLRIRAQQPEAE